MDNKKKKKERKHIEKFEQDIATEQIKYLKKILEKYHLYKISLEKNIKQIFLPKKDPKEKKFLMIKIFKNSREILRENEKKCLSVSQSHKVLFLK